ncbi:MAG: ABC transporter permease [Paenibacillaceae bacterium ZCTH02-B3]|nr:MAG: ABC transporter permease [Paenibacillaceae bacterium ZCTH02-B3]
MRRRTVSYSRYGFLFCLPFILAFLVFSLYPILYTVFIGFTDLKGAATREFHVLDDPFANFKNLLFENELFRKSILNTGLIWIINFIPQLGIALLLTAWFTNRRLNIRGQSGFKILFYMPNMITAGTIAVLFSSLFAYPIGPVNSLYQLLGWSNEPINFLLDKWTARGIVSFIQYWMWYGHTMLILIAGVMGINPVLYEAAEIDGANGWQQFLKITLPGIRTIILFILITSMIGGLQMFDIPFLFQNGGPDNATYTAAMFIYSQAFRGQYLYNRAAAASMILFVIAAILSAILFYVLRDRDAARIRREERRMRKEAAKAAKGGVVNV